VVIKIDDQRRPGLAISLGVSAMLGNPKARCCSNRQQ
jgi:hypothetical protein